MPTCWIIAGPNGAGKTTFSLDYLPKLTNSSQYINADLIAAGISPFSPEKNLLIASRLFLNEIEKCIDARNDFAFETTLSGRAYLRLIERLKAESWQIILFYLALPNVESSIERVAERVIKGGHNIPTKDIRRRFPRSLNLLLNNYSYIVDQCTCFMNNENKPKLVFEQLCDKRYIVDYSDYQILEELSK